MKTHQQTRMMSVIETLVNTVSGIVITLAAATVVYPWFGHSFTFQQNVGITAVFTVLSMIRGYGVRRLFNWILKREVQKNAKDDNSL